MPQTIVIDMSCMPCCGGGGTVECIGCTLPTTILIRKTSDDSLFTTLTYDGADSWNGSAEGWYLEFFCSDPGSLHLSFNILTVISDALPSCSSPYADFTETPLGYDVYAANA